VACTPAYLSGTALTEDGTSGHTAESAAGSAIGLLPEYVSLSRPGATALAIQSIGRFSGDRRPRRTVPQNVEECHSRLPAARVLVVATPPVRCDHRQYEPAALADQILVGVPIAVADHLWRPGKVVLDGPAGGVLEVHEQQPIRRVEHVPPVGLAVQQLPGYAPVHDRPLQTVQRAGQNRPVRIREAGSDVAARNVTRTTMSHGVRRTTSRLESLRTTALSTAKPAAEAVDIAAATARRLSAACTHSFRVLSRLAKRSWNIRVSWKFRGIIGGLIKSPSPASAARRLVIEATFVL
jgi:hypothetical protein